MVEVISESSKNMYATIMKKMLDKGETLEAVVGWAQMCLLKEGKSVSAEEISSWIKNDIQ